MPQPVPCRSRRRSCDALAPIAAWRDSIGPTPVTGTWKPSIFRSFLAFPWLLELWTGGASPGASVTCVSFERRRVRGQAATARIQRAGREVWLGHVGLVLALEVSGALLGDRHRLLDMCTLTGTLIAEADGVAHPGSFNSVAPPLHLTAWRLGARALPELSARRRSVARAPGRGRPGCRSLAGGSHRG